MRRLLADLSATADALLLPARPPHRLRLSLESGSSRRGRRSARRAGVMEPRNTEQVVDEASPAPPRIVGPTGVGKTAVAVRLAARLPIEAVNADSRQVYRGMDIGTGKPRPAERAGSRHHLIDVVDPDGALRRRPLPARGPRAPSPTSGRAAACRWSSAAPASTCARSSRASIRRPRPTASCARDSRGRWRAGSGCAALHARLAAGIAPRGGAPAPARPRADRARARGGGRARDRRRGRRRRGLERDGRPFRLLMVGLRAGRGPSSRGASPIACGPWWPVA